MEKFKWVESTIFRLLPGKEIEYLEPFTFKVYYYFQEEEPNREYLEEQCDYLKEKIELQITDLEIFSNGVEINV